MKHPNPDIEALLSTLASPALATIDLSLDRVNRLLNALGNPQNALPPVIHVAGTNGKGSLVAYLTAIMQSAGYRVHRYTSPYLIKINENIVLADKEIDDDALLAYLKKVTSKTNAYPVTYFEAITVAALLAFRDTPADVVLLETGLGGRLDATNTVNKPLATAITPVSIDHKEFLGNSITEIAGEKAGIIKANIPCVVGPQSPEALLVIAHKALQKRAALYRFGEEWQPTITSTGFGYISLKRQAHFPVPNLPGTHQIYNAATAVAVIDCLAGFDIEDSHIKYGITHAHWPARLQRLDTGSLTRFLSEGDELWLDGGHNPGAGEVLAQWIKTQKKPVYLICGMLKNKDIKEFLAPLAPNIESLTSIAIEGQPLSQSPSVICSVASDLSINNNIANSPAEAIQGIVSYNKKSSIILICGSLYLAGNILWQNNNPVQKLQ